MEVEDLERLPGCIKAPLELVLGGWMGLLLSTLCGLACTGGALVARGFACRDAACTGSYPDWLVHPALYTHIFAVEGALVVGITLLVHAFTDHAYVDSWSGRVSFWVFPMLLCGLWVLCYGGLILAGLLGPDPLVSEGSARLLLRLVG